MNTERIRAAAGGLAAGTPAYAVIDAAGAGDNTIVAAQGADQKIRVLALALVATGGANTARFESGPGGTALTGQMGLGANGVYVLTFNPAGWFETAAGVLLNLELLAATSVDGHLTYVVTT